MKLGEALKLRSDNQKNIVALRTRAVANAQIQEGTEAAESAQELLETIERLCGETKVLIQRINRTNVGVRLASGQTIADAIVERDHRLALRAQLDAVAKAAEETQGRFRRSEIRVVRTVEPAKLRKRADEPSREHRIRDVAHQEANWTIDLSD